MLIATRLAYLLPEFAMQTNLWLITDELAEILAEYHVLFGSSIDWPETLTNYQRVWMTILRKRFQVTASQTPTDFASGSSVVPLLFGCVEVGERQVLT